MNNRDDDYELSLWIEAIQEETEDEASLHFRTEELIEAIVKQGRSVPTDLIKPTHEGNLTRH